MPIKRTVNQGHDRLTRIAERALAFIEADPDYREGDRIIVALNNDNGRQGGLGLSGYIGRDAEDLARADILRHTRSLSKVGEPQLAALDSAGKLPPGLQRNTGPGWLSNRGAPGASPEPPRPPR